jgi:hypothetical protein
MIIEISSLDRIEIYVLGLKLKPFSNPLVWLH